METLLNSALACEAQVRRCLHDLSMPHYHHELVKQALCMALEFREAVEPVFTMLKVRRIAPCAKIHDGGQSEPVGNNARGPKPPLRTHEKGVAVDAPIPS